ncbi:SGNH/GDSL hydrolase family protein [Patulibacter defluvii]|uniref:SGNH/GDSL hydrolase family protein n=1 Tax=Patulibacter defluvii TaxID=3095358 RepID=UPI002A753210|nr:SGNH/GDSL hydrolase family protein [Patulibacter sp. DM4]
MTSTATVLLEDRDPHALPPDRAAALLADAPWRRLAVLGDSVAAGLRGPCPGYRDRSWADRLADALAPDRYDNLGVRDLRTAEIREQQLDRALALTPDLVVVAAGGNDALSRRFDPVALRRELRALLEPLAASGAQLVTIGLFDLPRSGLLPAPLGDRLAESFDLLDALTRQLADDLGAIHVDGHRHPLAADPGIFADDRMHANARGHAIAAAGVVRALAAA